MFEITDSGLMLPEIQALVVCSHEYGHPGWDGCGHWCVSKNLLLSHFLSVSCTLLSCFAHAVKHLFLLMGDHLLLWLCGRSFKVRSMVTEQTQTYWAREMPEFVGTNYSDQEF